MSRRDTLLLLLLSAIWGGSFLFIKVGVGELEPSVVALSRVAIGAAFLFTLLPRRGWLRPMRHHLLPLLVLGAFNNAVPFWLFGFAEQSIDTGLTAIIQASAPLFTVILASRIDRTQRVTGVRLVGLGVGFVGVVLLIGLQSGGDLVAALAVVGVALCYAFSVLFAGRTMRGVSALHVSFGQLAFASLLLAPLGLAQMPDEVPSAHVPARDARSRSTRLRSRVSPLLHDHCERGRLSGDPRHVPGPGVRTGLRRARPRRADHSVRPRRA